MYKHEIILKSRLFTLVVGTLFFPKCTTTSQILFDKTCALNKRVSTFVKCLYVKCSIFETALTLLHLYLKSSTKNGFQISCSIKFQERQWVTQDFQYLLIIFYQVFTKKSYFTN